MSTEDESYISNNDDEETSEENDDEYDEGISDDEEPDNENENYNHLYENGGLFDSRDEALTWVREIGMANDMYFTVSSCKGFRTYVDCDRGGQYRPSDTKEGAKPRHSSGSKKIECLFQVILHKNKHIGKWSVLTNPKRGRHNHSLGKYKQWHRWSSQLKPHELDVVRDLHRIGTKPMSILENISADGKVNHSRPRHIYNAVQKIQREEMGSFTPLQFFFNLMRQSNWIQHHRPIRDTTHVGDIFFAHPESAKVCRVFSQVVLVDATYNTNRYKLPLVQFIGFVPTGQNYHVAFAYMQNEREESYTWVMQQLRYLYLDHEGPRICITDRELALMNAIRSVFPNSINFLCRKHIGVNVQKRLTGLLKSREKEGDFGDSWKAVVNAQTSDKYEVAVDALNQDWIDYPALLVYLSGTWLEPHHHRFVKAWTNQYMHFGNTTTNRVESSHSQLKRRLASARVDFHTSFRTIQQVVEMQLKLIKGEFEKSRTIHPHCTRYGVFNRLGGIVSHKGIELMEVELRSTSSRDPNLCDCTLQITHGLPCACVIIATARRGVPIDPVDINIFWRTLDFQGNNKRSETDERFSTDDLFDEEVQKYKARASDYERRMFTERLRRESNPEWNAYEAPLCPPLKGRPKKSIGSRFKSFFERGKGKEAMEEKEKKAEEEKCEKKGKEEAKEKNGQKKKGKERDRESVFLHHVPQLIRPFVTGYHNVDPDGNCGFRVLSHWFYGGDETQWVEMRYRLQLELEDHPVVYKNVLGDTYDDALHRIMWDRTDVHAPEYHWMRNPESALIAATHFGVIVNFYSVLGSWMCLPLRCDYDRFSSEPDPPRITWNILHLGNHYIRINVRAGAPMPYLHYSWRNCCDERVRCWEQKLGGPYLKII